MDVDEKPSRPLVNFGITVLAVTMAVVLRGALTRVLGAEAPFGTFIVAVVFVAWYLDLKQTILAIVLGFAAAVYFFIPWRPPDLDWSLRVFSRFGLYFFIGGSVATFGEVARRAQRRLKSAVQLADERAETLRITFASIGDAIITTDNAGKVAYLNSVAEALTGYRSEEVSGLPVEQVFRIVNELTRQPVENPVKSALEKRSIVGLANHTLLISKDRVERPIDDTAAPIFNNDREVVGCVLVFRDVSLRRREQLQMKEMISRLESTLVAGEIGTWEYDVVNDVVLPDANLARMFGLPEYMTSGAPVSTFTDVILSHDRQRVIEAINNSLATETNFQCEYRVVSENGQIRWVIARGRVERDSTGRAIRLPGVVVDITQQKFAEEKLRESELLRKQALESADLGAWNYDLNTGKLSADARFREIYGLVSDDKTRTRPSASNEDVDSSNCTFMLDDLINRIHPEDQERVRAAIKLSTQVDNPVPYLIDYRIVSPNGEIRWIHATGRTINYTQQNKSLSQSFNGTVADITDRKRMENDLRNLAANLSEADQRKDEFLATLAHELRNPLAPIRSGLEIMRLSTNQPDNFEETRQMIERQLSQLVRLVDDLMDVNRISRGKLELHRERLNLEQVINSAIETSRNHILEKGHDLIVTMPQRPVFIYGDHIRLAQVLMNLIHNASKYSEAGKRIWLTATLEDEVVVVSIRDEGVGIAREDLHRVFDLFSQLDHSLSKAQGGLGIGLSLVKRIVEMHDGSVSAKSEGEGLGAEFVLRLPMMPAAPAIETPKADSRDSQNSALRILVVDDNRDGANSLSLFLRIKGNEVRTAYDGVEAIEAAADFHPEVILLDIGLPKLNGYEVCKHIRSLAGSDKIFIVAQTGWGAEEDRVRSRAAGFDQHLVKPVNPTQLMSLLAERCANKAEL